MSIDRAIEQRRRLSFRYAGHLRIVEPHIWGMNTRGHEVLSAWQTGGSSRSDKLGWKLFHVEHMHDLRLLGEHFEAPQPDYNPDDPHFESVWCQL